jgi:hypothetical protein
MRTLPIPQAPGIAGRRMTPAELGGLIVQANTVDRLARRIGHDLAQGVRVLLTAIDESTRGPDAKHLPSPALRKDA